MLRLYNSLSKKIEPFISRMLGNVSIYVCGITPYDTTHLAHAFTYISFDVLIRVLKCTGYSVSYTQNVTDINDRDNDILRKALEQNTSWQKLGNFWTEKFLKDMQVLNWTMPNNFLKASENIDAMINLIKKLLVNGYAYEKNRSVYFDIAKKKDFGKLSGFNEKQMLKTAKEFEEDLGNSDKKNPLDITLWRAAGKNQPIHIPSFDSPFGKGRPGWHLECSAMAISSLGDQLDIHGGGIDLLYPHHEAEIAQSEGSTLKIPFAKFWMHTALVSYRGQKMSKSLGNLVMISDLLKIYSANAVRWYLISHHYRQPFEFSEKDLEKSKVEFSKISEYINCQRTSLKSHEDIFKKFIDALENDLNTPFAIGIINKMVKKKQSKEILKKCLSLLGFII